MGALSTLLPTWGLKPQFYSGYPRRLPIFLRRCLWLECSAFILFTTLCDKMTSSSSANDLTSVSSSTSICLLNIRSGVIPAGITNIQACQGIPWRQTGSSCLLFLAWRATQWIIVEQINVWIYIIREKLSIGGSQKREWAKLPSLGNPRRSLWSIWHTCEKAVQEEIGNARLWSSESRSKGREPHFVF